MLHRDRIAQLAASLRLTSRLRELEVHGGIKIGGRANLRGSGDDGRASCHLYQDCYCKRTMHELVLSASGSCLC